MGLLRVALRIEFEIHVFILGICLGFKCEVMAEFSVYRLWPV